MTYYICVVINSYIDISILMRVVREHVLHNNQNISMNEGFCVIPISDKIAIKKLNFTAKDIVCLSVNNSGGIYSCLSAKYAERLDEIIKVLIDTGVNIAPQILVT